MKNKTDCQILVRRIRRQQDELSSLYKILNKKLPPSPEKYTGFSAHYDI